MGFRFILALVSVLILSFLLFFYLIPFNTFYFTPAPKNSDFSLVEGNTEMQFYSNMRFPSSDISYRIFDCPLQKKNDMQYAFEILENITNLKFNPLPNDEEISVTCEEKSKPNGNLFIAGEGGPTNITVAGNFNVIRKGEILLIKDSGCIKPNVALHELLHVLGFKHSVNPNNLLYNVTNCNQEISDDVLQIIDKLYSLPSSPDLILENVSVMMDGRFLETNFSVINGGFADAEESTMTIYAGEKIIKEINIPSIPIGYGRFVHAENIWVSQLSVNELTFAVNSNFEELNKENNKIILERK